MYGMTPMPEKKKLTGGRIALLIVLGCAAVFIAVIAFVNLTKPDSNPAQTDTATESPAESAPEDMTPSSVPSGLYLPPEAAVYSEGEYAVGDDIPAGEYFILADRDDMVCWMQVDAGISESAEEIAKQWVYNFGIVTVSRGQKLTVYRGEFCALSDAPPISPENGVWPEGMYQIGTMLPAGEYLLTADTGENPWYEISRDSTHTQEALIDISNFGDKTTVNIAVEDGQYLLVQNATIRSRE